MKSSQLPILVRTSLLLVIACAFGSACDCGGQVPNTLTDANGDVDADNTAVDANTTGNTDSTVGNPDSAVPDIDGPPRFGKIVINEIVSYPINDWSHSDGAGAPFQNTPGAGAVNTLDEYVELLNLGPDPMNVSDWTLEILGSESYITTIGADGVTVTTPGSTVTDLQPGHFLVIGNPAGNISSDAFLVLRDRADNIVDDVEIGGLTTDRDREEDGVGDGAPTPDRNGFARGTYEEAIARLDGASDTDDDQADFVHMHGTPLYANNPSAPPVETDPPGVLGYPSGTDFPVTSLLKIEFDETVDPLSTDTPDVITVTADGQPVALGFTTFEDDDNTVVINPIGRLPFDSEIVVTMLGDTGGVTDEAGNPMVGDLQFSVHTEQAPANPGAVLLNEICASPAQDWNSSSTGDSSPFSTTPGSGLVTASDEWIELLVSVTGPIDLSDYQVIAYNGPTYFGPTRQVTSFSSTSATIRLEDGVSLNAVSQGDRVIIGNPDGVIHANSYLLLRDGNGLVVDEVELGGVSEGTDRGGDGIDNGAPAPGVDASSSGVDDETVARVPDGADTGDDVGDFAQGSATIGSDN